MLDPGRKMYSRDVRWECRLRAPLHGSQPLVIRGPEDYHSVGPDRASVRPVLTPACASGPRPSPGHPKAGTGRLPHAVCCVKGSAPPPRPIQRRAALIACTESSWRRRIFGGDQWDHEQDRRPQWFSIALIGSLALAAAISDRGRRPRLPGWPLGLKRPTGRCCAESSRTDGRVAAHNRLASHDLGHHLHRPIAATDGDDA